eukprot:1140881-Pelagomonas_calceolata.AAC.1
MIRWPKPCCRLEQQSETGWDGPVMGMVSPGCSVAGLIMPAMHPPSSLSILLASMRKPEMVVGWYHSHPGFGCWLSGVDINTQQFWSPFFASKNCKNVLKIRQRAPIVHTIQNSNHPAEGICLRGVVIAGT